MKKSILIAALITSSGAVSAQNSVVETSLTDTITWKGKVPAMVVGNDSIVINSLSGSLDDAVLAFYRNANGTLALKPTIAESFEVHNNQGKATNYTVTLKSVEAIYGSDDGQSNKLTSGSVTVKRNDKAMAVGEASAKSPDVSNFTLELTADALKQLEKQEDAQVVITATIVVGPGTAF